MRARTGSMKSLIIVAAICLFVPITAVAANPENAPDDTWISVSGTAVETGPDSFQLDYGKGVIKVEMDDFDSYHEGYALLDNDQVVVYGKIDDDLFEQKKIEASSVYVENLNTTFYASAADEEDFYTWTVVTPIVVGRAEVTGTVASVNGRKFTVDTGAQKVQVDTGLLAFNPMDDEGFLKIDVGDRVKASGSLGTSFFGEREINADAIIELKQ